MPVNERDIPGIWIPIEIWEDPNLTPFEKMLLGEINSFDSGNGCFAKTKRLVEQMKKSASHLDNCISSLLKRGYLIRLPSEHKRNLRTSFSRHLKKAQSTAKSRDNLLPKVDSIRGLGKRGYTGACGLRGRSLIPSTAKVPWADRMTTRYADWTIKNRLHLGRKGSTRNGWTPQMLVSWRAAIGELAQQIGSRKEVREMMEWYFANWKEEFMPKCPTLRVFCHRYCDVLDAQKRATQKKRRKNGEDDNEKANPKGYWENDVFIPAEEEV